MSSKIIFSFFLLLVLVFSCRYYVQHNFRQTYEAQNQEIHFDTTGSTYFKVHFKNGDVGVLDQWKLNNSRDSIVGEGKLYDFNRNQIKEGPLAFYLNSVAIIETNQLDSLKAQDNKMIAALSLMTGANIALDLFCIIRPKACFGSCPTFYLPGDHGIHTSRAEGFSNAIAPALEKGDIDALGYTTNANTFELILKNEALETHAINELKVLAVKKQQNEAVFHDTNDGFYICEPPIKGKALTDNQVDISDILKQKDDIEYFSLTDTFDLFQKEEIFLEFDPILEGKTGMVITFRQTLLTTFLLYSGLSYMGDEVGDYFAMIERYDHAQNLVKKPFDGLGGITCFIYDESTSEWRLLEELYETGPIAKNTIVVPLPENSRKGEVVRMKLKLARGLWRLDEVGLSKIQRKVQPRTIYPRGFSIKEGQINNTIQDILADDRNYFITLPGDEYQFQFDLPYCKGREVQELFLYSKGYYLEWIRQQWLADKNLPKLKKMLTLNSTTWRELAKEYKSMEAEMECEFWNTKYSKIQ